MRNSFIVQYAVHLWIASIGITSVFWGGLLAIPAAFILGSMLDKGIIQVDIMIDKLKQGLKTKKWKAAIEKAYGKAISKVYTEKEKEAIREQYKKALADYASFGN